MSKPKLFTMKFLLGERVAVTFNSDMFSGIIRSQTRAVINEQGQFIRYHLVQMLAPASIKGRIYNVPIDNISKLSGNTVVCWSAVNTSCGWSPEDIDKGNDKRKLS